MTAPTTIRIRGHYPETHEVEVYKRWQRKIGGRTLRFVLHLQPTASGAQSSDFVKAMRQWQISEESTGYRVLYLTGRYGTAICDRDVGRSTTRCLYTQTTLIAHAKKQLDEKIAHIGDARFLDVIDRALANIAKNEAELGTRSQPEAAPATYHHEAQQQ